MKASPLKVAPSSETGADLSGDPDATSVKVSLGTVVVVVVDVELVEVVVVDVVVVDPHVPVVIRNSSWIVRSPAAVTP
jgi:hypothetical protein